MQAFDIKAHTGYPGLDAALLHVRLGDNVVFQIDSVATYRKVVRKYVESAWLDDRQVIYFRFACHDSLLEGINPDTYDPDPIRPLLTTIELDAADGFEAFVTTIYKTATEFGLRAYYVFDCLSDLLVDWASDLMIGNFFQITCPYLFQLETVAYFSLIRGRHTDDTVSRIRATTQLLINLYESEGQLYIHPMKVWNRHTSTIFLPHRLTDERCIPLTNSGDITGLYLKIGIDSFTRESQKDYWDRLFEEAKDLAIYEIENEQTDSNKNIRSRSLFDRLIELLFGRRSKLNQLLKQYMSLADLVGIHRRQIGSGQIGGKTAGMLLARKILERSCDPSLIDRFEPHDSFYLGSDLYYTYIVYNGWWKLYMDQKTEEGYYTCGSQLQEALLQGSFPEVFRSHFKQMLDYFGQSPIIVRSSSLLEDDFGHAFAGKYESIFCVNQGSPEERYQQFEQAIRSVYASTMNESALAYRLSKQLAQHDEQMALLVQRVSGDEHGTYFYPSLAGVGYSKNLYIWNHDLDPDAGMVRLVYGLGTRAVDRVDGDYPRLISLDYPFLTPHDGSADDRKYSQKFVDVLNLQTNQDQTISLSQLINSNAKPDLHLFGEVDYEGNRILRDLGIKGKDSWILNFKNILKQGQLVKDFQQILRTLTEAYDYPVDMEFTVNFMPDETYRMNLLQCRPLQVRGSQAQTSIPNNISLENVLIRTNGEFMGGNVHTDINYVIYVIAEKYSNLSLQDRYQVARTIGHLNRSLAADSNKKIMLIGPGRWGTTTPSLGIPVRFSEISRVTVLAEYSFEATGMRPELSFGSHFFQDLVEADIFYLSIDREQEGVQMNESHVLSRPNLMEKILPEQVSLSSVIHVSEFNELELMLHSDVKASKLTSWVNKQVTAIS